MLSRERAEPTVRYEHPVDRAQHCVLVGAGLELHGHVVEGPLHLIGGRDRVLEHPHRREARVVRHEKARVHGKYVLRRQRVPHDQELPKLAVDHRREMVSRFEPVRVGERLVDQHLVVMSWP